MNISSRTPEGGPYRCDVCGKVSSIATYSSVGDATCPHCGSLLWISDAMRRDERVRADPRARILALVNELAAESQLSITPAAMLHSFLKRTIGAVGARAGIAWDASKREIKLLQAYPSEHAWLSRLNHPVHLRYLRAMAAEPPEEAIIVPDDELTACFDESTRCMVILASFRTPVISNGIIEVLQRPDTPVQARHGFQQFVQQMVGYLVRSKALNTIPDGNAAGE